MDTSVTVLSMRSIEYSFDGGGRRRYVRRNNCSFVTLTKVVTSIVAVLVLLNRQHHTTIDSSAVVVFCDSYSIPSKLQIQRSSSLSPVRHATTAVTAIHMVQPQQPSIIIINNNNNNALESTTVDATIVDDTTDAAMSAVDSTLGGRRRTVLTNVMASMIIAATTTISMTSIPSSPAVASGGATAGRYTTIPIAKRRYYGRVQQAVHEFLLLGPLIVKGDIGNPLLSTFFDVNGVVVVPAKRKDVNGQCTKKDNECKGREIRDSRYNDMKASMYLLGNAFRTDQQKPPDRLPTVKAARAFFKEMNDVEKAVQQQSKKQKDSAAAAASIQTLYLNALAVLDIYLDLVELPPTDSGRYDKEFDTLVGETARIT